MMTIGMKWRDRRGRVLYIFVVLSIAWSLPIRADVHADASALARAEREPGVVLIGTPPARSG
jgi:hypothetical protein